MAIPDLKRRSMRLALAVIEFCRTLPPTPEAGIASHQLLRAGTGAAANYRAACRPRSTADFIAKIGIAIEEADETQFWLELLVEAGIVEPEVARPLLQEVDELIRIYVTSRQTARCHQREPKRTGTLNP